MLLGIISREMEKATFFLSSVESSEKPGTCHLRRPVSRDRRVLVMGMKAGTVSQPMLLLTL